jgi:hypothetical protein
MRKIKLHSTSGLTPLEIAKTKRSMGKNNHSLSLTGFTFIEIVFATAILATTIIIMIGIYFNLSHLTEDSRYFIIAANDARMVMEEIKAASYYSLSAAVTPPPGFATWRDWAVAPLSLSGGGLNTIDRPEHGLAGETVRVNFVNNNPLEVIVIVNFHGKRQLVNPDEEPLSVSLRTRITDIKT